MGRIRITVPRAALFGETEGCVQLRDRVLRYQAAGMVTASPRGSTVVYEGDSRYVSKDDICALVMGDENNIVDFADLFMKMPLSWLDEEIPEDFPDEDVMLEETVTEEQEPAGVLDPPQPEPVTETVTRRRMWKEYFHEVGRSDTEVAVTFGKQTGPNRLHGTMNDELRMLLGYFGVDNLMDMDGFRAWRAESSVTEEEVQ
jgi:hypothetical protein